MFRFVLPFFDQTADSMTNSFAQQMELYANTLSKTIWPWTDVCKVFKVEEVKIFSKWINPIQTVTFTTIQPAPKVMAVLFVMSPLL